MLARRFPSCSSLAYRTLTRARGDPGRQRRRLTTLAIETSCDDTAVAILTRPSPSAPARLLFNERITSDNREFKGIHPSVSVTGHSRSLAKLVRRAVASLPPAQAQDGGGGARGSRICHAEDGTPRRAPDFVSATRGPGIPSALSIGLDTAKGLAVAWGVPLVGVHHMQAHALTPQLVHALASGAPGGTVRPAFPFLTILVSGGHTQLVHSTDLTTHRIVANTVDVAVGNALDQAARLILPPDVLARSTDVMYGRLLEAFAFPSASPEDEYASVFQPAAKRGTEIKPVDTGYPWSVSLPCRESRAPIFTFSGIYTVIQRLLKARPEMPVDERRALARHTMGVCFRHLADRLCVAHEDDAALRAAARTVVVAGGVASNRFLIHVLRETMRARLGVEADIVAPPVALCTDNAAMIAWAGMSMFDAGWHTDLGATPIAKWPMDPGHGPGLLGVGGWLRR